MNALPLRIALEKDIKLIFYAEHGKVFMEEKFYTLNPIKLEIIQK